MSNNTTSPAAVELWIRSFAPTKAGPTQERALERLEDLEGNMSIESVTVGVWGREVEVDRPTSTASIPQLRRIETRLEAFESWATRTDRCLEPFFRTMQIESLLADDPYDVWRLPTVALAEFDEDDELLHVAPCRDGEQTIDVADRLAVLTDETETPTQADGDRDQCTGESTTGQPSNRAADTRRDELEPPFSRPN